MAWKIHPKLILCFLQADIPDSFHIGLPRGCRIVQAAIQRKPAFPEDKRYIISTAAWGKEPTYDCPSIGFCDYLNIIQGARANIAKIQAGLMIHEVMLRKAIELGHTNSIDTRYFHAYIMSQKYFALKSVSEWQELKRRSHFDRSQKGAK